MSLDQYQLRAQLGAGPDGITYRALAEDGDVRPDSRIESGRAGAGRWGWLMPRLRLAAELDHPSAMRVFELGLDRRPALRGPGMGRHDDAGHVG